MLGLKGTAVLAVSERDGETPIGDHGREVAGCPGSRGGRGGGEVRVLATST
jgi:hypothetical protein